MDEILKIYDNYFEEAKEHYGLSDEKRKHLRNKIVSNLNKNKIKENKSLKDIFNKINVFNFFY